MIEDLVNKMAQGLSDKKEQLLIDALITKGYSHYLNFQNQRFPKVVREVRSGWTCYYAYDGSDNGQFIIGFKEPEINYAFGDNCQIDAKILVTQKSPFIE